MTNRRINKYDCEANVHLRVAHFMKREYPGVIFRTDFAAGIKLPVWLASRHKALQAGRGFPDIFIYQPTEPSIEHFHGQYGLALELKALDVKLKLNDGRWADEHISEQYRMLKNLNDLGYAAAFARGYDEAVAVINWYLKGEEVIEFEDFIPKLTLGDVIDIEEAF